jgi:serine/threonine-protein kinase
VFPQIFGKYVLDRELASGGMARVYLATLRGAVGFEKRLVVKQIRPELASDPAFVRRFVDEAKTAVELSHSNIVPVYELGVEQGVYYIAMEFCAGATLAELLAQTGSVSPEEGAYLGVEICRALDYAHRRAGIVHRDVTPRNVLIDEEGAVRLIDFGIAAPVAESGRSEIFGSPGHMPPEQLAGRPLTPAADVFAVATLLFEAWTGKPAFRRATARASAEALKEPVPRIDTEDAALSLLAEHIARGLSLDPAERPPQAELFARPLRDFLRNVDAGDVARRLAERVRRTRRATQSSPGLTPSAPGTAGPRTPVPGGTPKAESEAGGVARTHTFAARDEVLEWTRRIDSKPPTSNNLVMSPPSNDEHPSGGTAALPGARPAGEPGLEGVELAGHPSEPNTAAAPLGPAGLEAPTASSASRGAGPLAWLALTAVLAGAIGIGISRAQTQSALRAIAPRPAVALRPVPSASPGQAIASPPGSVPVGEIHAPQLQSADLSAPPPRFAMGAAAGAHAPLSSPQALAVSAHRVLSEPSSASAVAGVLRLTADPQASVSLQGPAGSKSLSTPVRELKLAPGVYVVTFRNDTYGAPVVTRVTLTAGGERSVHVDFREVEPRVSVR